MFTLAIHGGAGTILRTAMTSEAEAAYHAGLAVCLRAGHAVLAAGGSAVDAVTEAVVALEENALFNAGRGAVFTSAGTQEMDAAIMDGRTRDAGAVAGIFGPRNPIRAARAVMDSEHVMLAGEGALAFCRERGMEWAAPAHFYTAKRWQALQTELARRAAVAPDTRSDADRHGTVGAVARDAAGDIAAATSTGGMTGKRPGRIGDCPVIGAGTWADNATCAISATGHGEFFIRRAAAHEIAARMRYTGETLMRAAEAVVTELGAIGGSGGIIAVDAVGNVALPFNSPGMYRGRIAADGVAWTGIYKEALLAQG
jgi:isoaspartyl peptidase/L-asparaginase-like protein (Ntn-hydrolase superfamily)